MVAAGDVDITVAGLERLVGHVVRDHRAAWLGGRALTECAPMPLQAPGLQGHGGVGQADFQKSAFARCAALDDSGQNSREGVLPGREIDQRDAETGRWRATFFRNLHHAAESLDDGVIAPGFRHRADLPKRRDAAINQAAVEFFKLRITQPQPVHHPCAEILHHHVAGLDQAVDDVNAALVFQVDDHAALVPVHHKEQRARSGLALVQGLPVP